MCCDPCWLTDESRWSRENLGLAGTASRYRGPSGRLSLSPPDEKGGGLAIPRPRAHIFARRQAALWRDRATAVVADVADDRPVRAVPGADPPAAADRRPVLLAVRPVGQQLQAEP